MKAIFPKLEDPEELIHALEYSEAIENLSGVPQNQHQKAPGIEGCSGAHKTQEMHVVKKRSYHARLAV